MFTFLHGYSPDTWDAMVRTGLVRKNDGIRYCQSIDIDESLKFNNLAKKGGAFYNLIKERNCPLYIDRLQGGCYIEEYDYDENLLGAYREMLGDNFWGFQMHEWLSNYFSDINWKLSELSAEEWTAENIEKILFEKWPGPHIFLESMNLNEIVSYGKPATEAQLYNNMTAIFKKRLQEKGELIPCDSAFLAYPFELSCGVKRIMPEVGAQTADARVQICYARGMTRQDGKSFGVYYEPWGGDPFSSCMYNDLKNEWGITEDNFPFKTAGHNGGSSRSLQKRIFLYGYLSNADFISEEWGVYNTFLNCEDFTLSPYGQVKKEFIDFVEKYPDVGEKLTPMAAVLPSDLNVLSNVTNDDLSCNYPCADPKMAHYKQGIRDIFTSSTEMLGSEIYTLKNSNIPDAIDLLNRNDAMLQKYQYLIDLTGEEDFGTQYHNLCQISHIPQILKATLPCYVDGGLHWMVNRCDNGGYYLTVFNHSGVERSVVEGERYLPEATQTVTLTFQNGSIPKLLEGNGILTSSEGSYQLAVPAGGFAFLWFA